MSCTTLLSDDREPNSLGCPISMGKLPSPRVEPPPLSPLSQGYNCVVMKFRVLPQAVGELAEPGKQDG